MTDVLTRRRVERGIEEGWLADWKRRRYESFDATMTDDDAPFPCYFAAEAHEAGDMRYLFAPPVDTRAGRSATTVGLAEYLQSVDRLPTMTSLVALFEPVDADRDADWYEDQFWALVKYLNRHDPRPWPEDVPSDPANPQFEFCFAGKPVFVVARAPCYEKRHSRHTPHGLEITVQPRSAFDGLGGDTEAGREARHVIRDRLAGYDDVALHPDIGDYGDPESREWRQYFLPDDNDSGLAEFPFEVRAGD